MDFETLSIKQYLEWYIQNLRLPIMPQEVSDERYEYRWGGKGDSTPLLCCPCCEYEGYRNPPDDWCEQCMRGEKPKLRKRYYVWMPKPSLPKEYCHKNFRYNKKKLSEEEYLDWYKKNLQLPLISEEELEKRKEQIESLEYPSQVRSCSRFFYDDFCEHKNTMKYPQYATYCSKILYEGFRVPEGEWCDWCFGEKPKLKKQYYVWIPKPKLL